MYIRQVNSSDEVVTKPVTVYRTTCKDSPIVGGNLLLGGESQVYTHFPNLVSASSLFGEKCQAASGTQWAFDRCLGYGFAVSLCCATECDVLEERTAPTHTVSRS